ncbi:integrator complex subunit 13 [Onthophagus taurus]|uniref:integrator complex subunit 13 n=1 Tax=Onthophagus taurus TaxID=166361 RepID=UPI000C2025DA|nr:integrator complex subunit 13 [Onthophagus taurus]
MAYTATNKMFPANHKTVFVLDHTPYFGISCESTIEFDFQKGRNTFIPIQPIHKSLWTCSVESAIEYCRIVWDLFPSGKLVKFIVSDSTSHSLNTWSHLQQNTNNIMNGLALIGTPPSPPQIRSPRSSGDFTVLHGLRSAVEALNESTDIQQEKINEESGVKVINRGRIICITSARDNESMKRLEEIMLGILEGQNETANNSESLIPIDHCHLVILNTFPINVESQVSSHGPKILSPNLTTEVHPVKATQISTKLSSLILQHYDLGSTTVTGIPMKEEQNASSSANYDVEIFHSSDAHATILKGTTSCDATTIKTVKEGFEYETVTLKWCTPRGCSAAELQNCTKMHRITPVDVNSRPSLCLINFLLNGRSVMLEMLRKTGGKMTSHLLAAHGGEIFIHTLCTARSVLEDPPSISEGCGGRVTDYRIPDFGLFIQQNKLLSVKSNYGAQLHPVQRMKSRLSRHTKYWPLTISSTLIFNLKGSLEPLPKLITKEKLFDEEVNQCKQVIYNLLTQETKHEPLNLPNIGQRGSKGGQKREEQYKLMWNELETLIKNNLHSENHRTIYKVLIECHKFNLDGDEKMEVDQNLEQRVSVIRATTDSPMSPPPLTTISANLTRQPNLKSGTKSLLDIYMEKEKCKSRPEFAGILNSDGPVTKLYSNLKTDDWAPREGSGIQVE